MSVGDASTVPAQVTQLVYETAALLGLDQHTLRVLHIGVLLEKNSADADHAVDELIMQVSCFVLVFLLYKSYFYTHYIILTDNRVKQVMIF